VIISIFCVGEQRGICNLEGHSDTSFAWGLGSMTYNEAKALALYAGISLTQSKGIQNLIMCGDSMMVTRVVVKGNINGRDIYSCVMSHSLVALNIFYESSIFHIKRELSIEAYRPTKVGYGISKGEIMVNGNKRFLPIP
jgi:hypothetical protein